MAVQLPFTSFDTINYWYQSKLLSKYTVIVQNVSFIFVALYNIYIILSRKPIEYFAITTTLNIILMAVAFYYSYKSKSTTPLLFLNIILKDFCGSVSRSFWQI